MMAEDENEKPEADARDRGYGKAARAVTGIITGGASEVVGAGPLVEHAVTEASREIRWQNTSEQRQVRAENSVMIVEIAAEGRRRKR
jgi:hypothetical protein